MAAMPAGAAVKAARDEAVRLVERRREQLARGGYILW